MLKQAIQLVSVTTMWSTLIVVTKTGDVLITLIWKPISKQNSEMPTYYKIPYFHFHLKSLDINQMPTLGK